MQKEKRKSVRVPVLLKVINESKEFNFGFSYAKDISAGGMSLDTKIILNKQVNLKVSDLLKLKFKIPGGKLYISSRGEIVRIDKEKEGNITIGIKFVELADECKKEIDVFVANKARGNLVLE